MEIIIKKEKKLFVVWRVVLVFLCAFDRWTAPTQNMVKKYKNYDNTAAFCVYSFILFYPRAAAVDRSGILVSWVKTQREEL